MADFRGLKGFALARESAFFKLEQEADIQRHRSRLVTQGRIEDIAGGYLMPRRKQTFSESAKSFEVLAEVLQQQARVDDPMAAQRRKFLRRVKVSLPDISDAERKMYRSALYGLAGIGQIPRPHLGRDKFVYHGGADAPQRAIELSPKAQEAAKRAFFTGVRSLAYGTVLGGLATVLVVGVTAKWYQGTSIDFEGFREGLQDRGQQTGAFLQSRLPDKSSFGALKTIATGRKHAAESREEQRVQLQDQSYSTSDRRVGFS